MQDFLFEMDYELKSAFKLIKATYDLLNMNSDLKIPSHSAGQWLLDNMYIIEQEYTTTKNALRFEVQVGMPSVKPVDGKPALRIMFMADEIINRNNGIVDDGIVSNYVREFQRNTYVTFEELSILPTMLRLSLIKYIKRVCINIFNAEMQKLKVEKRLNKSISKSADKITAKSLKRLGKIKNELTVNTGVKTSNTAYIEYMAYRLKDLGTRGEEYFEEFKEETTKTGFTIDEAIEKEHDEIAKTTSLIANSIMSMKRVATTNWGDVIVNVNRIDEILKEDYTKEYIKCDHKTKARYRHTIIRLAKKYKVSEMYIAKKAVECSYKYEKHVGHFLIGEDKVSLIKIMKKSTLGILFHNYIFRPIKSYIYILSILALATIFTVFVDRVFIDNYSTFFRVILDVVLFAFGMEIADKIIAYFVGKLVRPEPLPRFNFAKTIDKETSTMIAMPTVIDSTEKLDKMIRKMEITYLANRSENMYYMLLGDCTSSDKEYIDLDQKVVKYGKKLIDELNEKYPSEPKLFNFLYRKRIYSESEGCYMGWERKRGALTELNSLLLNKLSEGQIANSMYLSHRDIPEVKYMITIDEDTSLSLNSAKELVAIISHPLNKPVLSKNGKTVKSGYGLIQPAVGLDIESANNSIFSKVFGGFGGLDIYTNAISNVYQDLFKEAIYTGKGIYDIELFDKLIGDKVPENLILSHDLLEGSFMRTGLASDVEVQDGFPSNFIAYMKRNHRWFRGDMQIVSWLFRPKSGLNLLSRWKIFDNLRRESLDILAMLLLIVSIFMPGNAFTYAVIVTFVVMNFGYILSVFDQILFGKNAERKQKQYIPVIYGLRANLLKMVFNVITLPYKAWTTLNAFCTSLYRMFISKKKLLEWATAETIEKGAKEKLPYVYKNMMPNIIYALLLILSVVLNSFSYGKETFMLIFTSFILIAPYAAYIMSKKVIFESAGKLDNKEKQDILEIGRRTWKFFDTTMNEASNFLPPDNYQENRRPKVVGRTSSTNIGYGIMAIINAYDLEYIPLEEAVNKLYNIMNTVKKLPKWNGHLFNWYNTRTLEPLRPRFISTVDSGNFIASIYVANVFLKKLSKSKIVIEKLHAQVSEMLVICKEIMDEVDFTKLYVKSRNIFSIGYDAEGNKLVDSYYDMLMSESRLTSLIAIATSQITSKHWFALARNLVKINGSKGLMSWSGTCFEYFMPNLFTKTYKYTLVDESLSFALDSQISYAKTANVPWGVSESAFALQDNEQNYQYKAFGIPWLGLKRGLNDNMVVSPYSSLMCLEYAPKKVYHNIKNLRKYNSYSNFGFYEAIDFTRTHIGKNKRYEVVKTYMAHHQGMILTAINNYINNGIIQTRFHANPSIDAADILLKERIPLAVPIKENINSKYNKFIQPTKEEFTSHISYEDYAMFKSRLTPMINMHTNGKIGTLLTDSGANFMYYKNFAITKNRYVKDITLGNQVIFTDKSTGMIWSGTYAPNYKEPDSYSLAYSLAASEYRRKDGDIETITNISIAPKYNMEIRKYTLYNSSNERKEIVINTELELAMTEERANIIHPAFNSLLIEEDYDEHLGALIAKKRSRNNDSEEFYVFTKLVGIDLEYEIETEKSKLISNSGKDAYDGEFVKYPLWPVMSYRARILLEPGETQTFYYLTGAADTKYNISHTIVNADYESLEKEAAFAAQKENVNAKYLKLRTGKAEAYNNIISKLLFGLDKDMDKNKFWDASYSQAMLWKYGISGDIPIMTVHIGRLEDSALVDEVIAFMDYAKYKKVDIDIVLLVDEELYSGEPIKTHIQDILKKVVYMSYTKGDIYIVNLNTIPEEERGLFDLVGKYIIKDIDEFMPRKNKEEKTLEEVKADE
ncbi:MAG: hypothetical protein IJ272_01440 [Clostridia bacterium]|nr:hypothetical protein [Clostridia bacterium]